ncbi:MAG: 2-amino-4-hydroxy-6-hydroxymethyldihydropteridine diphosphokinase [Spirochaetes bacterium RBG_13_51_14]|nr:MAG: 2-amino-4-hydroxy-6-hydroxymethyldihydropteridine diphosphokinase [Spirochaetes bacterium RBG_13_51_14]
MAVVYIGLGSNLGDRSKNLNRALGHITSFLPAKLLKKSTVIETDPVDHQDQPRFLNQVAVIETALPPHELLKALQQAEKELGRKKTFPKGPRGIDLDILLYDGIILNAKDLTIPHPEIKNREFILRHLVELDPALADPVTGTRYGDMIKSTN